MAAAGISNVEAYALLDSRADETLERVASAENYITIAQGIGVSRFQLYHWLKARPVERLEALELRADSLLSKAADALENEQIEPARAREIAAHNRWMASKLARQEYGDGPLVHIGDNVNVGVLHLNALRQHGSMDAIRPVEVLRIEPPDLPLDAA